MLSLLALAEIERVNPTEWARERVFQLLDRRYAAAEAERSVTLFAGNSPPSDWTATWAAGCGTAGSRWWR
jgi:hypothetical protein